jgi:hypothetical protein
VTDKPARKVRRGESKLDLWGCAPPVSEKKKMNEFGVLFPIFKYVSFKTFFLTRAPKAERSGSAGGMTGGAGCAAWRRGWPELADPLVRRRATLRRAGGAIPQGKIGCVDKDDSDIALSLTELHNVPFYDDGDGERDFFFNSSQCSDIGRLRWWLRPACSQGTVGRLALQGLNSVPRLRAVERRWRNILYPLRRFTKSI